MASIIIAILLEVAKDYSICEYGIIEAGSAACFPRIAPQFSRNDLQYWHLRIWYHILNDKNHHIFVAGEIGTLVFSCVCVIIPNLTHEQRPYALIENVVTDKRYRKKGYATACLNSFTTNNFPTSG